MKKALVIFPTQLFKENPLLEKGMSIFLIEDPLFFKKFKFHKKKILLHRASMKYYQDYLEKKGYTVHYVEYNQKPSLKGYQLFMLDPVDCTLEKKYCAQVEESVGFLTSKTFIEDFFRGKAHYSMAPFYIEQRRRLGILVKNNKPVGGQWSFDTENRKKMPANKRAPQLLKIKANRYVTSAQKYVEKHFNDHYGETDGFEYPVTHNDAQKWLMHFLKYRLRDFGSYEDAMIKDDSFLYHSVLSPLLNIGLLTPKEVVDAALLYAKKHSVPLNSLEGFIRQIIGWREFMRAMYIVCGKKQRKSNFWKHTKNISTHFYLGTTGIDPVDTVIQRVQKHAYCHHIERLMVLGNVLLLCEKKPNEVYKWFMELFIDAYDWVMVSNVYGMSQYADGGLMTTKPYISGSSYIKKMSNYQSAEWCKMWDALYWNFVKKHQSFFKKNPRMAMMAALVDKMSAEKLREHQQLAKQIIKKI